MFVVKWLMTVITHFMVVEYIRVRKSNIKELQEMINQRTNERLFLITVLLVPLLVLTVALIGFISTL